MDFFEVIQQPFMLRAIYGGVIVAILCALLGVFMTLKKESFMADAVAHASLAGVALAFLIAFEPVLIAIVVAVSMSIGFTYFKKNSKIAPDSIIGMLYSFLFAIGIILINLSHKYQPELATYLFGSILSVTWHDIFYSLIVFVITILFVWKYFPKLLYLTFDKEAAYIRGVKIEALEYLINILTSITIIISIKVVGIILVTALLIIPATTAKLIARNFKEMIPISIVQSLLSTIIGITASYYLNVPTGASIVVVSGLLFMLTFIAKVLLRR